MKFWARALSASALMLATAAAQAATLTLIVSNIQSDIGTINIAVFDNKKDWLGDKLVTDQSLVVAEHLQGDSLTTSIELAPGDYGVSVHHDDNGNDKMDTNFIGIPKEPTGMSNDAPAKFGPPSSKTRYSICPKQVWRCRFV